MIYLQQGEKARLFLAMCDALGVNDNPRSGEEAQRLALCQLVAGYTDASGNYALHEAFRLAEALDLWLLDYAGEGPFGFSIANVARLVGGDRDVAKAALRLLGARPTFDPEERDDWSTAPGECVESIRFPREVLTSQIRLELEEAERFS